jgi:hypothetical protein
MGGGVEDMHRWLEVTRGSGWVLWQLLEQMGRSDEGGKREECVPKREEGRNRRTRSSRKGGRSTANDFHSVSQLARGREEGTNKVAEMKEGASHEAFPLSSKRRCERRGSCGFLLFFPQDERLFNATRVSLPASFDGQGNGERATTCEDVQFLTFSSFFIKNCAFRQGRTSQTMPASVITDPTADDALRRRQNLGRWEERRGK